MINIKESCQFCIGKLALLSNRNGRMTCFMDNLARLGSMGLRAVSVYQLGLLTLAYITGELTHFLINTTSRAVAR